MKIYDDVTVFSVERFRDRSARANKRVTQEAMHYLETVNVPYKLALGVFDGVPEQSFIVRGKEGQDAAISLATIYNQDCILALASPERNGARQAAFIDPRTNDVSPTGWLIATPNKPEGDHTYRPDTDTYYVLADNPSAGYTPGSSR